MRPMARRIALAALMALAPVLASGKPDPEVRSDTYAMEALLDRLVRRVSQPSAAPFFGATEAARAYRLQGFGVVFVVPPRALPRSGGRARETMGQKELSEGSASLVGEGAKGPRGEAQVEGELVLSEKALGPEGRAARERDLEALEAKVEALSKEASRQRAEAERALDAAMQDVRVRLLRVPPPPRVNGASQEPTPPALAPDPALPPPAPPWGFWFSGAEGEDPRTPERVVEDVKGAVTQAIAAAGGGLKSVRSDEFVIVAVDFVPQWDFGDDTHSDRTLVVRAKKKDLQDHDAGKLSAEELQKRIEVLEY